MSNIEPIFAQQAELPHMEEARVLMLGVIVGHTQEAPGAKSKTLGMYEYQYNKFVAEAMVAYGHHQVHVVVIYRDRIGVNGAYTEARKCGCDCVIELHFNAFNGNVRGTTTLCTADDSDVAFAKVVQDELCLLFNRSAHENQGVVTIPRAGRGGANVHSFPEGVNCLVEPFYGDNEADSKLAMDLGVKYAWCLVDAVVRWAKGINLIKT